MNFYKAIDNSITLNKVTGNFWETAKTPIIILGILLFLLTIIWIISSITKSANKDKYLEYDGIFIITGLVLLFMITVNLTLIGLMGLSTSTPTFRDSMGDIAHKYNMTIVNSEPKSNLYYLEEKSTHKYYKNCFIKNTEINENTEKVQLICDTSGGVSEMALKE